MELLSLVMGTSNFDSHGLWLKISGIRMNVDTNLTCIGSSHFLFNRAALASLHVGWPESMS